MKWPEDFIDQIICSGCLEVMKKMPDNCVDTIITDPPYGIGFMGKEWDVFKSDFVGKSAEKSNRNTVKKDGMASKSAIRYDESLLGHQKYQDWCVEWMKECLRVSKPGATFLCCGSPRVYHHIALATERAGWIIKDCIMWLYGSGFPKATDISKQIDKNILRIDLFKPFAKHFKAQRLKKNLTHKDIAKHFPSRTGGLTGCVWNWENAEYVPSIEQWNTLQPLLGLSDEFLPLIERIEAEREIIGKHQAPAKEIYKSGELSKDVDITAPATPEAIFWDGWKSHGLKPAYEPILVAMKPNEGSYANNALKYGVAGLNIDGGRIPSKQDYFDTERFNSRKTLGGYGSESIHKPFKPAKGRYPANVILDEEASRMLDERSGNTSVTGKRKNPLKGYHQPEGGEWFGRKNHNGAEYQDKGGASRFFYCAKASKAERNRGCEELYWLNGKRTTKEVWVKLNKENEENKDNPNFKRHNIAKGNIHPTVKNLALMKYLCTLTKTPTGGIVLDPFCGSGTTLMACKELKRIYIGMDNIPEYCEIARRRINAIPETLF